MQSLSENTQAVLLLCGVFDGDVRQLSTGEYNKLAMGLKDLQLQPADLIQNNVCIKETAQSVGIDDVRLAKLLDRGVQLGFTLEKWDRNGVWVVSRSDEDYPQRLKEHLKAKAPPIIHGIGDRSFLKGGGLAVVGSRNVDQQGEDFTRKVGEICAAAGEPVVSGGARGVDQIAMSSAIEAGGATIGILAEKLLKKSLNREARHAISDGRMVLISPYHPDASFSVGNAMGRNKLIYAMADYALVVSAEYKKGGTWAGAEEELKHNNPRPVFVRTGSGIPKGNSELLKKDCAFPWPDHASKDNLWQQLESTSKGEATITLAGEGEQGTMDFGVTSTPATSIPEQPEVSAANITAAMEQNKLNNNDPVTPASSDTDIPDSAYQALLPIILNMLPATRKEISNHLNIVDATIKKWLTATIVEGKVSTSTRKRITLYHNKQNALPLEEQASPKIENNIQEQIYEALLPLILYNCKNEIKGNDLAKALDIPKGKLFNECIARATKEAQIEKLTKPVKYKTFDKTRNINLNKEWFENTANELTDIIAAIMQVKPSVADRIVNVSVAKLGAGGAAAGVYGLVSLVGTAGTGTAISTLSGAAAKSATLAWIGGSVFTGTIVLVGIAGLAGWSAMRLWKGKPREYSDLAKVEQNIVDACANLAKAFKEEALVGKEPDKATMEVVVKQGMNPLVERVDNYLSNNQHCENLSIGGAIRLSSKFQKLKNTTNEANKWVENYIED